MARKKTEAIPYKEAEENEMIEIDISDEALMAPPVPASDHVALHNQGMTLAPKADRFAYLVLPVTSMVLASVVVGAGLIAIGVLIGAN